MINAKESKSMYTLKLINIVKCIISCFLNSDTRTYTDTQRNNYTHAQIYIHKHTHMQIYTHKHTPKNNTTGGERVVKLEVK